MKNPLDAGGRYLLHAEDFFAFCVFVVQIGYFHTARFVI